MKNSLIALAALACAGSALAQSSATLYGRIDTGIGSEKINGASNTQVFSGQLSTSRIGLRGAEDLGGGLKANFNLEGTLAADTGVVGGGNGFFDRQSWVGLSGGFGSFKAGRSDTAFDDIRDLAVVNNLWDSEFSPTKIAYTAGVGDYSSRASNMLRYDTPSLGGFSAGVSYALDENDAQKRDVTAYNLRYRAGALDLGLGFQQQKHEATPASDREYTALSASYKFDALRLSGGWQRAENGAGLEDDEYSVGVAVPFGAFELTAGYAWSKSETAAGATSAKGKAFSVGGTYSLSKRTRLYAAMLDGEVENGAGAITTDRRLFALGVRHDF
ncbi:porin [Ramlibacter tataouinensis]|uniref:porin n=1 Tax=Ramlibacter tataouinensis TaxID=94132 RepID=UPI0022F3F7A9|nr:porin [Ramlibacter tataouinensis]WBY03696.1 porin [Ramlibacter tataouinensis]